MAARSLAAMSWPRQDRLISEVPNRPAATRHAVPASSFVNTRGNIMILSYFQYTLDINIRAIKPIAFHEALGSREMVIDTAFLCFMRLQIS